jgi:hypothetical protein
MNKDNIYLKRTTRLTEEFNKDLLGGVIFISGMMDLKTSNKGKMKFMAVPYYSWNNRGNNKMTVWFPGD